MCNYEGMLEENRKRNENKEQRAIMAINNMVADGHRISINALVQITGLSRSFFYKNQKVVEEVNRAKKRQGKQCDKSNNVAINKALKKENDILTRKIKDLEETCDKLKKENERLKNKSKMNIVDTLERCFKEG